MMRLTVLGASPACPNPGGACSGYLLEQDDVTVLIDCGSGVFSRLQRYTAPEQVTRSSSPICMPTIYLIWCSIATTCRFPQSWARYSSTGALLAAGWPRAVVGRQPPAGSVSGLLQRCVHRTGVRSRFTDRFGPLTVGFVPVVHIPHTYGMRILAAGFSPTLRIAGSAMRSSRSRIRAIFSYANVPMLRALSSRTT